MSRKGKAKLPEKFRRHIEDVKAGRDNPQSKAPNKAIRSTLKTAYGKKFK